MHINADLFYLLFQAKELDNKCQLFLVKYILIVIIQKDLPERLTPIKFSCNIIFRLKLKDITNNFHNYVMVYPQAIFLFIKCRVICLEIIKFTYHLKIKIFSGKTFNFINGMILYDTLSHPE